MTYLVDTDILIRAKNDYYKLKICPGFLDFLLLQIEQRKILLIDKVREGAVREKDDLFDVLQELGARFILDARRSA